MKICKVMSGLCLLATLFLLSGCGKEEELQEITMFEEEAENSSETRENQENTEKDLTEEADKVSETIGNNSVTVHIIGAVVNPGVYELPEGSRVVDVLGEAAGFEANASMTWLNQARLLIDGEQIYVPTEEEADELRQQGIVNESYYQSGGNDGDSNGNSNGNGNNSASNLVNINLADAEQLMTLPGIGESKAKKIIAYREEIGSFSSIEELMNIPGIKEGVYNQIRDLITI